MRQLRNYVYSNRNSILRNATGHEERISTVAENVPHAFTTLVNIKKILAPTDLSAFSETGIRYALNAGRELGAEVIIYYVITGNEIAALGPRRKEEKFVPRNYRGLIESYEMRLKSFIEEKFGNALTSVRVEQKVEFGTPEKSIVEIAKAEAVDLIIMASRGKRGLIRMFLGSVTEEVIRNAPCPVIAVPRSRRKPVELCPRRRKKENAVKRNDRAAFAGRQNNCGKASLTSWNSPQPRKTAIGTCGRSRQAVSRRGRIHDHDRIGGNYGKRKIMADGCSGPFVNSPGLEKVMFEAAEPEVIQWYIKNYAPELNLFVDHSQIVELEACVPESGDPRVSGVGC